MPRRSLSLCAAALIVPLATLPLSPATAVPATGSSVFINEIHYDNGGTDTGEAIEVAAPAGTDLSGWSLVLYNGDQGGTTYDTHELGGTVSDQEGGFGTVVAEYPSNGVQNGGDDGIALVDAAGEVVQFLSYEGSLTAADGPAEGLSSTELPVDQGGDAPAGWSLALTGSGTTYGDFTWASADRSFGQPNPDQTLGDGAPGEGGDPGEGDPGEGDPGDEPDACEAETTHEIGEVQGTGDEDSLAGTEVTVAGVVVGDFQGGEKLNGVYLQDAVGDGDPATSDGIFVFTPDGPELAEGDQVTVSGRVGEYYGLTQISQVSAIGDCGDAAELPAATPVDLPATDAERERLEGMRVSLDAATVTEVYNLDQYGEIVVSSGGRLFQPTNDGGDDADEQALNDRQLIVGDASTDRYPDEIPFTDLSFEDGSVVRVGDTVTATGVMSYGFDAYRLQPTGDPEAERTNPRPAAPDAVGGDLQVGSFNVLNYFTTLEGETDTGDDPRGADTPEELQRQQDKIVSAITRLDAEVVGLMEIENDRDDEAVDTLVAALNERTGEQTYAAVEEPDTGGGLFGSDAIKVAMIYQPDAVVPMGSSATTTDDAFDNARLPLAQRFRPAEGGKPFTVVVNHFKSKGCYGDPTGDNADLGDGQSCWNADRVEQARALVDFMGTLDGSDFMVIGDLNSYGEEDPVDVLEEAGFVDLVDTRLAEADQYTYVYFGQSGYLDHALATPQLARRVTGADIWHINADEAPFLDYDEENPERFYEDGPYRSSDHDPVLVGVGARPGPPRR